jgi:hypothetical protein
MHMNATIQMHIIYLRVLQHCKTKKKKEKEEGSREQVYLNANALSCIEIELDAAEL